MNAFCKAPVTLSNWFLSSALALIFVLLAPALAQADDSDKKAAEINVSEVVLRDIPFEASVSGIGDRLADGAAAVL